MVTCNHKCAGIALDLSKGILPRCLIFESEGRENTTGTIIIGINPGRAKQHERDYYVTQGATYEQVMIYWNYHLSRHRKYFTNLRWLSDQLGFNGPILWTELVKCQNVSDQRGLPPLQTFRTCTRLYLQHELRAIPEDWPIIAVGWEAYKASAYLFADRPLVGVPHVTGSYGHFANLFDKKHKLLSEIKDQATDMWDNKHGKAIWLIAKRDS